MLPVKLFTDFIDLNNLFGHSSKVLAAVSGGMDSVVMVHLLKSAGINFGIAHCNFRLRGNESTRDQEFCRRLAEKLQVPFHTINFDTLKYGADEKISTQMAARDLRYRWFEEVKMQSGYSVIALAHHQNDAIETILLNLIRGTGIAGMHGILPKNGALVRPLLCLNRDEIKNIIDENGLDYVEDSSNESTKYARNKLRLEVIPKLKELNPALEQTFEKNLQHFRELEQLLEHTVAELKQQLFVYQDGEVYLLLDELKKLEPQRLLLFNLLQAFGVNETIVDDLIASLDKHPGRLFETPGYRLVLDRGKLIISHIDCPAGGEIWIRLNDRELEYPGYKLTILHDDSPLIIKNNPLAVSIDTDLLIYPLTLRAWRHGDHFYPLGMRGNKKISDFFIGEKVPLHKKNEIPLLINGNGEVIWVGGYRPDERYKVSKETKKVTIFELVKI
ncbi:tRNA lysidine(34) synthetase TilS [Mucilaginibacter sp.]|uniref:tRNA lysidine(34) synthetase TilS n=1 Tax=Mucilaginibacter sp. TaxID=1882438 RepID=UPI00284E36E7|nr:tRNA lysidine(34) synthetase TilS [Mucilaginibacter sp.]MDR3696880.1 tRNA lysidine(34) synthetase TilS [Mucilaginibacter sp.]